MSYRKIGGIHWLRLGRFRIAFCITRPRPIVPRTIWMAPLLIEDDI